VAKLMAMNPANVTFKVAAKWELNKLASG